MMRKFKIITIMLLLLLASESKVGAETEVVLSQSKGILVAGKKELYYITQQEVNRVAGTTNTMSYTKQLIIYAFDMDLRIVDYFNYRDWSFADNNIEMVGNSPIVIYHSVKPSKWVIVRDRSGYENNYSIAVIEDGKIVLDKVLDRIEIITSPEYIINYTVVDEDSANIIYSYGVSGLARNEKSQGGADSAGPMPLGVEAIDLTPWLFYLLESLPGDSKRPPRTHWDDRPIYCQYGNGCNHINSVIVDAFAFSLYRCDNTFKIRRCEAAKLKPCESLDE